MEAVLKTITTEKMQEAFDISSTYSEVISRIGLSRRRQVYSALTEYIWKNKIDLTQFFQNSKNRPKFNKGLTQEEIFKKDSVFSGSLLKKIKQYNLKDCSKCEICGISDWMGKPITFQVHHKDGDRTNDELDNLQILCPNCHTQTDNYGSKNIKKKVSYETKRYFCVDCGKELAFKGIRCSDCNKKRIEFLSKCPSKEELEVKAKEFESLAALGRYYQVSDNTVKKWLNKFNLPYPKRKPKKYKPKVNYPTYRVDDIIKTATRWERYLKLPKHKIARYVSQHTKEEIESYIKTFYDKFYLINT